MTTIKQGIETEFQTKLNKLIETIQQQAQNQLAYDIDTNLPANRVSVNNCAEHALQIGFVGAVNELFGWDTDKAVRLAYAVMEDANCHTECRELVKFIPEYQ